MDTATVSTLTPAQKTEPLCPIFGVCGGCAYQDRSYDSELAIKDESLRQLFASQLPSDRSVLNRIVPSPHPYHYRNRLDITLKRTKDGRFLTGFQLPGTKRMVSSDSCVISRREISDFIPQLREEAIQKLPSHYRNANLVVRTGDDGRVFWGGIGRRSLELKEEDYLWTEIRGRKIFYSLDVFFQANLSILPRLMDVIEESVILDLETTFLDLYAGVGLFGMTFADRVGKVVMIEESPSSLKLMRYNVAYHGYAHVEILEGKVEEKLHKILLDSDKKRNPVIPDQAQMRHLLYNYQITFKTDGTISKDAGSFPGSSPSVSIKTSDLEFKLIFLPCKV